MIYEYHNHNYTKLLILSRGEIETYYFLEATIRFIKHIADEILNLMDDNECNSGDILEYGKNINFANNLINSLENPILSCYKEIIYDEFGDTMKIFDDNKKTETTITKHFNYLKGDILAMSLMEEPEQYGNISQFVYNNYLRSIYDFTCKEVVNTIESEFQEYGIIFHKKKRDEVKMVQYNNICPIPPGKEWDEVRCSSETYTR